MKETVNVKKSWLIAGAAIFALLIVVVALIFSLYLGFFYVREGSKESQTSSLTETASLTQHTTTETTTETLPFETETTQAITTVQAATVTQQTTAASTSPAAATQGRQYVTDMRYTLNGGAAGTNGPGKFTGHILNGKPEDSNGVFVYDNGGKYTGGFINGKRSGQGKWISNQDVSYSGEWNNDLRNGQGVMITAAGDTLSGTFKKDKPNGMIIAEFSNGEKFVGNCINGIIHGYGTYYRADGTISYQGLWENDELVSQVFLDMP